MRSTDIPQEAAETAFADHSPAPHSTVSRVARIAGSVVAAAAVALGSTGTAIAQESPYERGPDPTESLIEDPDGPFDVDEESVSSLSASGFGGGTIYYPDDTSEGTFGGIAIAPGYTAGESSMAWLGERLASHGFVVFTIDTITRYDQPDSRGDQLAASLEHMVEEEDAVEDVLDPDRLAVMGHSMGGGGTLAAAENDSSLRAAIPLTGWHTDKTWGDVEVPTMVIGAEDDTVASVRSHSIPFYESLDSGLNQAYLELRGASHFAPNFSNTTIAKYSISWMKRFVDEDTRYDQFLCPLPGTDLDISDYRGTCPLG